MSVSSHAKARVDKPNTSIINEKIRKKIKWKDLRVNLLSTSVFKPLNVNQFPVSLMTLSEISLEAIHL